MKEVWKKIDGYDGYYVSNLGRIKSIKYHKAIILKGRRHTNGYLRVSLSNKGVEKDFYIHRLVAQAFLPKKKNMKEINHLDGNKANNRVDNLEWSNRSENEYHKIYVLKHGNAKRIECVETGEIYESLSEAAKKKGFAQGNLSKHLSHNCPKTIKGTHWKYAPI